MSKYQFNFENVTTHTVEVAGKEYTVRFGDDDLKRYAEVSERMAERAEAYADVDEKDVTSDDLTAMIDEQKESAKDVIETILGEGTFDELYEKAGRSVVNLLGLIDYLNGIIEEHTLEKVKKQNEKRAKYVRTRK